MGGIVDVGCVAQWADGAVEVVAGDGTGIFAENKLKAGNAKGGGITVPLTSCLTCLD